jgi:hypothetical protein
VSFLHLFQCLRVGEIEAVAEVNDRAEHGGKFDLAAGSRLSASAQRSARL